MIAAASKMMKSAITIVAIANGPGNLRLLASYAIRFTLSKAVSDQEQDSNNLSNRQPKRELVMNWSYTSLLAANSVPDTFLTPLNFR